MYIWSNAAECTFAGSEATLEDAWELVVLTTLPALLFVPETAIEFSLAEDSPNAVLGRWTRGDAGKINQQQNLTSVMLSNIILNNKLKCDTNMNNRT